MTDLLTIAEIMSMKEGFHTSTSKYIRMNPYLGCSYEISEKQALRKINSKWWTPVWDDYLQKFSENSWYDIRDVERDWIFKVDD